MRFAYRVAAGCGFAALSLHAQPPAPERVDGPLPTEAVQEAVDLYNAPGTVRAGGRLDISADREIRGDVAVLNGPLVVGGRIVGRVVAINANVTLRAGASIEGSVLILGGRLETETNSRVTGSVRVFRRGLWYHMTDERIVAETETEIAGACPACQPGGAATTAKLSLVAGPYNRVEGLPIYAGPRVQFWRDDNGIEAEALGVIRSAENFHWDSENVGHKVRAELRHGLYHGFGLGATVFDVVAPVEAWQTSGTETALASAFLHRDFRDHYNRHGGALTASFYSGPEVQVRAQFSNERWASRRVRDPWSLFRNSEAWRPNPAVEEGRVHVATVDATFDTRNDSRHPWAGWLATMELERGQGTLVLPGSVTSRAASYTRALVDLRRYNRISPNAQLNLRLVWGGRLGGNVLPPQRRLSVGGPGTLPGYAFRGLPAGTDVGQCSDGAVLPGTPALCERIALAQVEYRGAFSFGLGNAVPITSEVDDALHLGWHGPAQWVAFADAGRGWLVGARQGNLRYPASTVVPPAGTLRMDLGLGIDMGPLGVYAAKAVSQSGQPVRVFVRLGHRF